MWEPFRLLSQNLVASQVHSVISSSPASPQCFLFSGKHLYRKGCVHSLGWESGSGSSYVVKFVWSQRDCAGNSKPSSFCQLFWGMNRLVFCIPITLESWHEWSVNVSWAFFSVSLCLLHIISASWLPA